MGKKEAVPCVFVCVFGERERESMGMEREREREGRVRFSVCVCGVPAFALILFFLLQSLQSRLHNTQPDASRTPRAMRSARAAAMSCELVFEFSFFDGKKQ
jgi:hypothetical protein